MKRTIENCSAARNLLLALALAASFALPLRALAGSVALATAPLATSTTSKVLPNVMFILDNSGSMDWDYLPDWADDTAPGASTSYRNIPALHRNAGFNGVAYDPSVVYAPPVLYNADGTLNTTTYPNIGSPWTSVKDDAYGKTFTGSSNLVTGFPDVEWCTSTAYTTCLRNDNYLLPGIVGGLNYRYSHSKSSTGSGSVATGSPDGPTAAARSFGPFYYTIVPGEYCDTPSLKNCQSTKTATFSYPAVLRWCDSSALTNCQALNSSTYKYPRYPTTFFQAAIAYQAAVPAKAAVPAVIGVAASSSFTFNYSGSLNPVGFSISVNGTNMLTSSSPGALLTSAGLASWVASHSVLSGYAITSSGSTVTIVAVTTGTAKNISSVVISETPPASVSYTTNPASVVGVTPTTAVWPTGLIKFSGGNTSGSTSATISRTGSSPYRRTVWLGNGLATNLIASSANPLTIGKSQTPAQAAATAVAAIGTGGTIQAYVGGNAITPICASQTTSTVCLVDTTTYANGTAVSIGSTSNFSAMTVTTTATAGGNSGVGANAEGTITFTNPTSLNPSGFSVKVNGAEIMSASTPAALTSSSGMATWVAGNSSLSGYSISSSGSTVTIHATAKGPAWNINTIAITQTPPSAVSATTPTYIAGVDAVAYQPATPYIPEVLAQPATYYGSFIRTDIVSTNNSYPYPGTAAKATGRTDCAGTTCTYAEEMTNFANWWTYYHSRMQAMKTSVSRAFKTLDNRFRVGFSVISYTGATDGATFLGNKTFELAAKNSWFTTLFASDTSGSTPLRGALSKAGRYYGNKLSGQVDPVQYSCQQNFTIISTDGYWNQGGETSTYKNIDLSGSLIGDLDGGSTPRPMYEGTTASSGSLADIAKFYYDTDLRTSALGNCGGGTSTDFPSGNPDVCTNNVFVSSADKNLKQHMTTFTMGLGAEGTLNYMTDYLTANFGDYYDIKNGLGSPTRNWPDPQVSSTSTSVQERIDDLWHAAVNGQGIYFSAKNPDQIIAGFNSALSSITAKLGAAAAAATSTLNPVAGNNFAYVASYTTVKWTGNLEARSINTGTGVVSGNATWCVENVVASSCASPGTIVADTSGSSTVYNCVVPGSTAAACTSPGIFDTGTSECKTQIANACTGTMAAKVGTTTDTRTIFTANDAGNGVIAFDAAYASAHPTYFAAARINALNQWGALSASQQTAAAGTNLINFLRGQNGYEDRAANAAADRLYRARETVLGDALESQPAFISKPVFNYPYAGYSAYKTAQASRVGTVYMGTNDGMMHAFAASDGTERWAYVPSMVIPNMWKLASTSYGSNHVNFANGSAVTTDIYCPQNCGGATDGTASASWRTILVAGLNGGGRGYYALDITVPTAPTFLWEFTTTAGIGKVKDDDLGYSFGQPIVTRKADGTWVVLVTSGYNNTSPGDGFGYLFVLDANTGAIISKIGTGVGGVSGLAKIAGWNDEPAGNKVGYVYGGDLLGNVWRFDINSATAAAVGTGAVMKFATLFSDTAATLPQPITTAPVLGKVVNKRIVFVGTGQYLQPGDLTTTQRQTQYAIKDDNATVTLVNPRTSLVNPTLTNNPDGTATRVATPDASGAKVDFLTGRGWFVDFPDGGSGGVGSERANIDSKLVEGTLLVPTIVPSSTVCSPGGYGWLNYFDYKTGLAVIPGNTGVGVASAKYDSTIVGVNVIFIGGEPKVEIVTSTNPTPELDPNVTFNATPAGFTGKRFIWRELMP